LKGVAVLEIKAGSKAGRAGLRPGDVILRTNHKRIESMKEMKEAVKENENRPMLIRVKRQDSSLFLVLPP
jgi:S1-C subfamily serine protease